MAGDAAYQRKRHIANPSEKCDASKRWRVKHPARAMLSSARARAKYRGQSFSLKLEDFAEELAAMTCSVTGVELHWEEGVGRGNSNPWRPSLDRIDSSKGYTPENTRVVCWAYNMACGHWDDEVIAKWAKGLVSKQSELANED